MRSIAEVTVAIAIVAVVAAFALISVVAVFDATIAVSFTTFGTDDSLVAGTWDLCESFESANCV